MDNTLWATELAALVNHIILLLLLLLLPVAITSPPVFANCDGRKILTLRIYFFNLRREFFHTRHSISSIFLLRRHILP